jgi:hypothetical protein
MLPDCIVIIFLPVAVRIQMPVSLRSALRPCRRRVRHRAEDGAVVALRYSSHAGVFRSTFENVYIPQQQACLCEFGAG